MADSMRPKSRPNRKTDETTAKGRPVWVDGVTGEKYSERSVTFSVEEGGKEVWYTFPTVAEDGTQYDEDIIREHVQTNGPIDWITGEALPNFESQEEAVNYAKERSRSLLSNTRQYSKGGEVKNMQEQMRLFEEGGIADDGMSVDPVSGNEIPPGSLASEVRDDIPAQLSEGEYVVPADVLRYYGVRFFEDLRAEAKQGLSQMDADGRIGGEPVPAGGPQMEEGDLTPEEMAVLQEMGMNVGGFVPQQPAPEAVGNTTMQMDTAAGYAEGGLETDTSRAGITTPGFTEESLRKDYGLGFSIFGPSSSTESTMETLYSPDGQVRSLRLPDEQEEYDRLISEGWTTAQTEVTTETSVGAATGEPDRPEVRGDREGGGPDGLEGNTPSGNGKGLGLSENVADAISKGVVGLGKAALGVVTGVTPFGVGLLSKTTDLDEQLEDNISNFLQGNNNTNVSVEDIINDTIAQSEGVTPSSVSTPTRGSQATSTQATSSQVASEAAMGLDPFGGSRGPSYGGGNEGRGGNEAAGVDGPAPGASAPGDAPGVSAGPSGASAGAASSAAAGSGHEGNADPAAGGSMLKKGGLVQRPTKKKKK